MQPTTSMDIHELQNRAEQLVENTELNRESVATTEVEPDTLDEVVTAPQAQLNQLDSDTPKQPVGNSHNA